jgi:hypothetical protein
LNGLLHCGTNTRIMIARLFPARRRPAVTSADALTRFLCENAALIAQKTVIGYCNARTSLPLSELMRDKPFADAFERSRWQSYTAVLEDLFTIAEGRLRPATAAGDKRLVAQLVARFDAALGEVAIDTEVRRVAVERLQARLQAAQCAPPHSIADIAHASGGRVFEAMPIHERFRRLDRDSIIAGVRFLMVGLASEFDRRLDVASIVADLLRHGTATETPAPA